MSFSSNREDGIKKKDGKKLKLKLFYCSKSMECIDTFSGLMFRNEATRMTSIGLVTPPNLGGIDLTLAWLSKNCKHPQRKEIREHIKTLEPLGVVIPTSILNLIDKKARELEGEEIRF
jgi:hypothetical protein